MRVFALIGLFALIGCAFAASSKNKESLTKKLSGICPVPTTLQGDCTFVAGTNCLNDQACTGTQKCCREGCNKICKEPIQTASLPDFESWKKWKDDKVQEWNDWASETKKLMIGNSDNDNEEFPLKNDTTPFPLSTDKGLQNSGNSVLVTKIMDSMNSTVRATTTTTNKPPSKN